MRLGDRRRAGLQLARCRAAGKQRAVGRRQPGHRQHRRVAPMFDVGLARLRGRREEKVRRDLRRFLGARIERNGQEMRVADRALGMLVRRDGGRQSLGRDLVGDFVRIEGQRDRQLAIGQHLPHHRVAGRELLALFPQVRVQRIERRPQRRSGGGEDIGAVGRVERFAVGRRFDQHLLDEGRAVKRRWLRVGETAGGLLRPLQQLGDAGRRFGHTRAVGVEGELRHAPRRFHAFDRFRKIDARRRLAGGVHRGVARQLLAPGAEQQALFLHRQKVLAVDPHQIDRAVAAAAGGLLCAHALHGLGGVGDLDVLELDAPALRQLARGPLQVGVDALTAGPGVHENRLALGGGFDLRPGVGGRLRA